VGRKQMDRWHVSKVLVGCCHTYCCLCRVAHRRLILNHDRTLLRLPPLLGGTIETYRWLRARAIFHRRLRSVLQPYRIYSQHFLWINPGFLCRAHRAITTPLFMNLIKIYSVFCSAFLDNKYLYVPLKSNSWLRSKQTKFWPWHLWRSPH